MLIPAYTHIGAYVAQATIHQTYGVPYPVFVPTAEAHTLLTTRSVQCSPAYRPNLAIDMLCRIVTLLLSICLIVRIAQINCAGISKYTRSKLHSYVDEKKIDILCLQETWLKDDKFNFKKWTPNINNAADGYGGVAILTHPTIKAVKLKKLKHKDLEAVWSKIQVGNQTVIIASVYIRPGDTAKFQILRDKLDEIDSSTPVIITGDFNGKSGLWQTNYKPPRNRNDKPYQMGKLLEQIILDF